MVDCFDVDTNSLYVLLLNEIFISILWKCLEYQDDWFWFRYSYIWSNELLYNGTSTYIQNCNMFSVGISYYLNSTYEFLMKENVIYNQSENQVFVKTNGDQIYIICNSEEQQDTVVKKMTTDNCLLESYEVWEDEKVILTFRVLDNYEVKEELN